MNSVIKQMLEKYDIKNEKDEINAMKEIIQEIVLAGLSRGNFFNEAAFYGGTSLRIFYGLNRFSEDLDFALLEPNKDFDLSKYFKYIEKELNSYGLNLKIYEKEKAMDSNITTAFLKGDTLLLMLSFFSKSEYDRLLKDIKIKFEVDINPPKGALYEYKYQLLPTPYQIRLYDKSSLFAGKIHAILCRNWKKRVKGRDLYDYIFFISNDVDVNLDLVRNKLIESKYIDENEPFDIEILKKYLVKRFSEIDYRVAKDDVIPFIRDSSVLDLWNKDFFINITSRIK